VDKKVFGLALLLPAAALYLLASVYAEIRHKTIR